MIAAQCRDWNGSERWARETCDCTERLERKLASLGDSFLENLRGGYDQQPLNATKVDESGTWAVWTSVWTHRIIGWSTFMQLILLVGAARFELTTPCAQGA